MQIIYTGKYFKRFDAIVKHIPVNCKSILELCFGDLIIAKYCKDREIHWTGYDINNTFVDNALKKGYNARLMDITELDAYPKSDVVLIIGSLYHFHNQLPGLFSKMTKASDHIFISEPVKNLSSLPGPIGYFSRRSANAGKGKESFRFTKDSLLASLNSIDIIKNNYSMKILHQNKDLIIELCKN